MGWLDGGATEDRRVDGCSASSFLCILFVVRANPRLNADLSDPRVYGSLCSWLLLTEEKVEKLQNRACMHAWLYEALAVSFLSSLTL
jgi:hypothetical protein